MNATLSIDAASFPIEADRAAAGAPDRQDDLAFFSGLWAILPVALAAWSMTIWAAVHLLG